MSEALDYSSTRVGDRYTLEPMTVSRRTLALYAGASGDHHPVHIDIDEARQAGFADVFAHGMLVMAYLGRLLTDCLPQQHLVGFQARFVSITPVRSTVSCLAEVIERTDEAGQIRIKLGLSARDAETGEIRVSATAVLQQPG
jgi:acyl dehydratase